MIDKTTTSVRQSMGDFASLVTSPYFSDTRKDLSLWKRSRHARAERQGHMSSIDPYENRSRKLSLTTSLYFAGSGDTGRGATSVVTQRKRRRRILRGATPDGDISPPSSPEELSQALRAIRPTLIQERICDDPWKTIVATTLLNKTTGKAAVPVFWELVKRWPTPIALAQASAPSLTELLRPLGTQSVRTSRLIRLSNAYFMHPPSLSPRPSPTSGNDTEYELSTVLTYTTRHPSASPRETPADNQVSYTADEMRAEKPSRTSFQEYHTTQRKLSIAHLPFAGPYAIDSFRIFSSALSGGGAGARVEGQLARVAHLAESDRLCLEPDGFDETPSWYSPSYLHVRDDDDAEWRKVWPEDKQLRRYLVWRWAIEGIEYDPEASTRRPANWPYLNKLIRTA